MPDLTENSDEDSDEYDESAIFRGFNRTDVPVGQPRDVAQAQPISNTISMLFTDVKGPMTPAGTKGEVYAQSFIEGDTKFYATTILRTGASVLKTSDTCWKMFCRRKEHDCLLIDWMVHLN